VIAGDILVNRHFTSWAFCGTCLDLSSTQFFLLLLVFVFLPACLFFSVAALVVLHARLTCVERKVVYSADARVAGITAEDVAFQSCIVDLARVASLGQTVAEVRVVAEKGAHGKLIEASRSSVLTLKVVIADLPCEEII
jgi:hypothetical protein